MNTCFPLSRFPLALQPLPHYTRAGIKKRMRAEQEDRRVKRLLAVPERRTGRLPEEQLLSGAAYCRIVPPGESKTQAAKGSLLAAARWRHRPVRRGASERTLG